jgi:hypothetical protein
MLNRRLSSLAGAPQSRTNCAVSSCKFMLMELAHVSAYNISVQRTHATVALKVATGVTDPGT